MSKTRIQLRHEIRLLDANIYAMRASHPTSADFVRHAEGAFHQVMSETSAEDKDWIYDAVDAVCTRHGLPYPAF